MSVTSSPAHIDPHRAHSLEEAVGLHHLIEARAAAQSASPTLNAIIEAKRVEAARAAEEKAAHDAALKAAQEVVPEKISFWRASAGAYPGPEVVEVEEKTLPSSFTSQLHITKQHSLGTPLFDEVAPGVVVPHTEGASAAAATTAETAPAVTNATATVPPVTTAIATSKVLSAIDAAAAAAKAAEAATAVARGSHRVPTNEAEAKVKADLVLAHAKVAAAKARAAAAAAGAAAATAAAEAAEAAAQAADAAAQLASLSFSQDNGAPVEQPVKRDLFQEA